MPRNRSASAWPPLMRRPASWRGRCRGFDALRELRDGHRVVDPWVVRHHRIKIRKRQPVLVTAIVEREINDAERSEEHTSELQSLMRTSYAVFCLKKKNNNNERPKTKRKQARTIQQRDYIAYTQR